MYTVEEITKEVQENKAYILARKYPEDMAHEYADSQVPIYYSEIIREWTDLPEEFSNKYHELSDSLPDRIEDLMRTDLYLYYWNHYSSAIEALVREREEQQEKKVYSIVVELEDW